MNGVEALSPVLGCDVAAFLAEADHPPEFDTTMGIQYLQVTNVAELTVYEEDPSVPDEPFHWMEDDEAAERDRLDTGIAALTGERQSFKIVDATSDDPITGEPILRRVRVPESHGKWTPPYHVRREFTGWGKWQEPYEGFFGDYPEVDPVHYQGAIALDFLPLATLLHMPLRYNPKLEFYGDSGKGTRTLLFQTELTITFGEFVHSVFSEIGFHGTPAARDEALKQLRERNETLDRRRFR